MLYHLTRRTLDSRGSVPLTEHEFSEIVEATEHLAFILGSEERLDMVVKNYMEFEHDLLQTTLATALSSIPAWSGFKELIQQFDRRLANLLSTCRLYLDHLRHSVSKHDVSSRELVKRLTAEQYDQRLGYRAMEAMRNHVQHRGLATHSVSLEGRRVDTPGGSRSIEIVTLFLDIPTLQADEFKETVLKELAATGDKVPLKPLVRSYVSGVLQVQIGVRKHYAPRTARSIECVEDMIRRYREQVEDRTIGLAAVAVDDSGAQAEAVDVSSGPAERIRHLERRNSFVGDLSDIIVSSQ